MTDSEALADEFDTMAKWTADAVLELGLDHAIPAACRGSGSPAALEWLAGQLRLSAGMRLLDSGAGVGGPAELAARRFQVAPVLAEPMVQACQASARLFGRPVVAAAGQQLPFAAGVFDAAWSLGVLCTVEEQLELLSELRRVVRPGALVGLLAFLRTVERLPDQPEGNNFPTAARLDELLTAAGFTVVSSAELADFAAPEPEWQAAADRVEAVIENRHRGDSRWQVAQQQEQLIGQLLKQQLVIGRLLVLQPVG
jgi:SAM-dependent methyltransferase